MVLIQEKQKVDTEMLDLREALKEAETKAKILEEERNKALQQLQASIEVNLKILQFNTMLQSNVIYCIAPFCFTKWYLTVWNFWGFFLGFDSKGSFGSCGLWGPSSVGWACFSGYCGRLEARQGMVGAMGSGCGIRGDWPKFCIP